MRPVFKLVYLLFFVIFLPELALAEGLLGGPANSSEEVQSNVHQEESAVSGEVRDLEQKAQEGNVDAQARLGEVYAKGGDGIKKSYKKASEWWEKAAQAGHMPSQYNLGVLYSQEETGVKDYEKAVKWFRKAAEQGDMFAQYNLAVKYAKGQGVEQNYAHAVKWWEKAAKQSNMFAQYNLGLKYLKGEGVKKNEKRAYAWFACSAAQGLEDANKAVSHLNGKLEPEILDEAKDLSLTYILVYTKSNI